MGFEIRYTYHPRKEDGPGYNEEIVEEKDAKVGKPFDDTPLEKCAAAIMAQLARRDILVTNVQVFELVKKEVKFKESSDGKGIVLKNKKFSLNQTAQLIEESAEEVNQSIVTIPQQIPQQIQQFVKHPHELMQVQPQNSVETLYSNPNATSAVVGLNPRTVDKNKRLYQVILDPAPPLIPQLRKMKVKLTEGKRYNVHASNKGNIAITDDSGQVLVIDEKYFSAAGQGLLGDAELGFSSESNRPDRPKLVFEDDMYFDGEEQPYKKVAEPVRNVQGNVPLDDGSIPEDLLEVPNLRPNLKV